MLDNLSLLLNRCKCGVFISVNEHRDYYQSVEEFLNDHRLEPEDIEEDIKKKMTELNTMVEIHFYPDTPIGFYEVYHFDINEALKQSLEILGIAAANKESKDAR